jgi:GWxTD domain-containing protein
MNRHCIVTSIVIAAGLAAAAAGAGTFPVASTGDVWFQADHAAFLGPKNEVVEEFYFRITNNQLQFDEEDGALAGGVFVHLKFRDEEGNDLTEAGRSYTFTVSSRDVATSPDDAQILVLREPLDLRTRSVEVEIEDMHARKRGLLYLFTGKRRNGKAGGDIDPPGFVNKPFALSDVQFTWEVRKAEPGGSFEKNGFEVVPNPSRSYGLLQPRLTVYYEVYDLREREPGPSTYVVRHELVDPEGNVLPTLPDTVVSNSGEWVKVASFDLTKLSTGEYLLRAIVDHPESGERAVGERSFNLLWKSEFWAMTEQDILDEARVLFQEEEYEQFQGMSAGDRALYVDKFWRDADPTPGTSSNELREEFKRRVGYANNQFHSQIKGMLTDRGRLYIRFGEPDEIQRELLPTGGSQLDQQVGSLTKENITGSLLATNDVIDTRPYEIWTYTRQGTPLFPERERTTTVTGLRFVFVDETGTGHYVLRYSSDFIGY